jgi:hypothetical protein
MLALAVFLFTRLCVRLGGLRFGILSGLFLATLGALPFLVAWVSCSQDLFAMVFVAAAMLAAADRHLWLSAVLVGLGLLSKETTLFFVPVVIYLGARGSITPGKMAVRVAPYAAAFALWAAMHPKIRAFLSHGFATGQGGYVGLDNPLAGRNALRMAGTFLNLPLTGVRTPWPQYLVGSLAAALVVLCAIAWMRRMDWDPPQERDRSILYTGILAGLIPGLLTVVSAKHSFPYYACLPALGTSMLLAYAVQGIRGRVAASVLALFMVLGVWYRGSDMGKVTLPAEANFRSATLCLDRVQAEFRKLRPQFPESAHVYLTIEAPLEAGLHVHLMHGQVLRTWYRQESITTTPAEYQEHGPWPEYLFWITAGCDVFEITLPSLRVRSPGPRPDYASYQRAIRSYALGAWAAGDPDRGVALLAHIQEMDSLSLEFDRRLAATILFASARDREAGKLLQGLRPLSYEDELSGAAAALTPELPRPGLDDAAFRAFGLSLRDTTAYSELMFRFSDKVLLRKAKRMAERVLALDSSDEDAKAMLEAIAKVPEWEAVMVPAEGWGERYEHRY